MVHMNLAQAQLAAGRLADAEASARAAHELLAPFGTPPYEARGLLAFILVRLGRPEEALELVREAPRHRVVLIDSHIGPFVLYMARAEALDALGDRAGAREAIAAARRIVLETAAKVSDPELRRTFVEGAPMRARVLAAYERLNAGG
jgi:tetratricopeptide (TPR) repeat protein